MVAFIVTVQLVEKSAKSVVGTEMVVSLMTKYKVKEIICSKKKMSRASNPIQDDEPWAAATSVTFVMAADTAVVGPPTAADKLLERAALIVAVSDESIANKGASEKLLSG